MYIYIYILIFVCKNIEQGCSLTSKELQRIFKSNSLFYASFWILVHHYRLLVRCRLFTLSGRNQSQQLECNPKSKIPKSNCFFAPPPPAVSFFLSSFSFSPTSSFFLSFSFSSFDCLAQQATPWEKYGRAKKKKVLRKMSLLCKMKCSGKNNNLLKIVKH